jgi:hypothetical protein
VFALRVGRVRQRPNSFLQPRFFLPDFVQRLVQFGLSDPRTAEKTQDARSLGSVLPQRALELLGLLGTSADRLFGGQFRPKLLDDGAGIAKEAFPPSCATNLSRNADG